MGKRLLIFLTVFCVLATKSETQVFASENFATTLDTVYTVSETGLSQVKHTIELQNRKPTVYAKQYGLKISSPNLSQIKVKSNGSLITPEIVKTENQTSIGITFPDTLLGENKIRKIEIEYQDKDTAILSGKVLEILIPKIANPDEYDSYHLTLNTPASFGQPNRVTPATFSLQENNNQVTTKFALTKGEGVVALFGTQQIFQLELQYHLENSGSNTGLAQIALPPDTTFQRVWYDQLEPLPQTIQSDVDGNWIATYQIQPQETLQVTARGRVLTTLKPMQLPNHPQSSTNFLNEQAYWPTTDSKILELSQQYQTPRAIYDYVVETLTYNYQALEEQVPRLGAIEALAKPDLATCQEFSDVFVTLARAAGLPTRQITGYAHTQNSLLRPLETKSDILHAWPEYFDSERQQWHPVDPTWGNTTGGVNYFDQFDLNHIAFAINGSSSTLPYPAGSYKATQQSESKDVTVSFAPDFPDLPPQLEVELLPAFHLGVPLPGNYRLKIKNLQGRAWYTTSITATSTQTVASLPQTIDIPQLLPFETLEIAFNLHTTTLWRSEATDLQLAVQYADDQNQTTTIRLSPFTVYQGGHISRLLSYQFAIPGLVIGSVSLALLAGSLLVRRRK